MDLLSFNVFNIYTANIEIPKEIESMPKVSDSNCFHPLHSQIKNNTRTTRFEDAVKGCTVFFLFTKSTKNSERSKHSRTSPIRPTHTTGYLRYSTSTPLSWRCVKLTVSLYSQSRHFIRVRRISEFVK